MKTIVLIACVKSKRDHKSLAKDLYVSDLFSKCLQYAESIEHDAIFILSAKHGLLGLNESIEPYDETLTTMSARERRDWADRVMLQLRQVADTTKDRFIFLAGERYREHLEPHLPQHHVPLKGLGIGRQLQFLKRRLQNS